MEYHVEIGPCGPQNVLDLCTRASWNVTWHYSNGAAMDLPWHDHSSWLQHVLGELHTWAFILLPSLPSSFPPATPHKIALASSKEHTIIVSCRHSVCSATNPRSLDFAILGKAVREGRLSPLLFRNQIPSMTMKCSVTNTVVLVNFHKIHLPLLLGNTYQSSSLWICSR